MTIHSNTYLFGHNVHGSLCAQKSTQQVHLDNKINLADGDLPQSTTSSVDTGVVDPVLDLAKLFLGKLSKVLNALGIRHIALGVEDLSVGMTALECSGSACAVLHVTDDHIVAPVHELAGIGESNSTG